VIRGGKKRERGSKRTPKGVGRKVMLCWRRLKEVVCTSQRVGRVGKEENRSGGGKSERGGLPSFKNEEKKSSLHCHGGEITRMNVKQERG